MFQLNSRPSVVLTLQVLFLGAVFSGKVESADDLIKKDIADWKTLVENIKTTLSPDIDPCSDFYSYVCTKYNNTESYDFKNMLILEPYLKKGEGLNESELKAKHYMHSCTHIAEENVEKFVKNFNFEKSIGSWPALDPNWDSENFDWQAALAKFAAYNIWDPILLTLTDISFVFNNYLSVKAPFRYFYIFQVEHAQIVLNKRLKQIGVNDINAVLSDAMQFENEYQAAGLNGGLYSSKTVLKNISALKEEIPEFDWDKYIEIKERKSLPNDFDVHLQKIEVVRRALTTISKMQRKVVANYLFCRFILDIPTIEIQRSKGDCWDETFDNFRSVLSQTILSKYVTENVERKVIPLINTYVDTIEKSLPPPKTTTSTTNSKYIKEIVEEYIESLSDEKIIKEYKELKIDPNSYLHNYYTMIRYNSLKYTDKYWNQRWQRSSQMEEMVAMDFPYQIYKANTNAWTSIYSYIALHYAAVHLEVINRHYKFNKILSDCFGEDVDKHTVRKALTLQILTKNFINWVAKNERDIQVDNDLLKEHGLNLKKALFVGVMQFWCEGFNSNEVNWIFSKYQEFGDTFECPLGVPMNPSEKCDIDKFEILA